MHAEIWLLHASRLHNLQHKRLHLSKHSCQWCPLATIFSALLEQCCVSTVSWTPSNPVRQVSSVILQDCVSRPVTLIIAHAIMLIQLPLFRFPTAPSTRPQDWRWPNKPRPYIMRSDSRAAEGEAWASPRLFFLAYLQFSEWLNPLDAPWLLGGSWETVELKMAWWVLKTASLTHLF